MARKKKELIVEDEPIVFGIDMAVLKPIIEPESFEIVLKGQTQAEFDEAMIQLNPNSPAYAMWRAYVRDGRIIIVLKKDE